jgi:Xaa-Pro aminopeptidase
MDYKNRLQKLRKEIQVGRLDALFVTDLANRVYLSGFRGTNGDLLITQKKHYLFTDPRYFTEAKDHAPHFSILHDRKIFSTVKQAKIRTLGVEHTIPLWQSEILHRKLRGIHVRMAPDFIRQLRAVKEETEIALLKKAGAIAARVFLHTEKFFRLHAGRKQLSEKDIAWEMEKKAHELGADSIAFDTIVAFDEASAVPHHRTGDKKLKKNSIVLLDFGVVLAGYHTDMTRMVFLKPPRGRLKRMHETVLKAQQVAYSKLQIGMTGGVVDLAARKVIEQAGFGKYFTHNLGHGIGLEIHEKPTLGPKSKDILSENMVFTIEPGIYIPGYAGVRIEDDILLGDSGTEMITVRSHYITRL